MCLCSPARAGGRPERHPANESQRAPSKATTGSADHHRRRPASLAAGHRPLAGVVGVGAADRMADRRRLPPPAASANRTDGAQTPAEEAHAPPALKTRLLIGRRVFPFQSRCKYPPTEWGKLHLRTLIVEKSQLISILTGPSPQPFRLK